MPDLDNNKLLHGSVLHRVLEDAAQARADSERDRTNAERFRSDALLRKNDLFNTVEKGDSPRRLICYLSAPGVVGIDVSDAAPIGSMLDAIGDCDNLDLMLNSPGGSGEAAEKIIDMFRNHCRNEFRVIVPNYAKSAATLVALGADTIVMGYLSELGPIDPQYDMLVGDVTHQISGHDFIEAFEDSKKAIAAFAPEKELPVFDLQVLTGSSMAPAFIRHCRRGIELSHDIAEKYLKLYQIPRKAEGLGEAVKASEIAKRAKYAASNLLSANKRLSHGRLIGPEEARDEVGLNVDLLVRDSATWQAYWELYVRGEVYLQSLASQDTGGSFGKLFFDRSSTLPVYFA